MTADDADFADGLDGEWTRWGVVGGSDALSWRGNGEGFKRKVREEREGKEKAVRAGGVGPTVDSRRDAFVVDRFSIMHMRHPFSLF